MSRETDIQKLCKQVLEECYPNENYNNGETSCPFCAESTYKNNAGMQDIKHDADCAYLIAKDLSTGF